MTNSAPSAGERFPAAPPRYRIEALCGTGGVGTVYRAWDHELQRRVALKFLRDDRPQHRARMFREARAQARVNHPNVCKVFDVGEFADRVYLAMEWIDGEPLDRVAHTLPLEERIRLLRDVAEGVHAAHSEGVIHRDLKPGNILVATTPDSALQPYVVDFGLARASEDPGTTATGEVLGTPHYLSPEQAWGFPVDRRADVYSLGATLYELIAGRPPFTGASSTDIVLQVLNKPPRKLDKLVPSVPRDLAVIVEKCMEKQAERRYDSARALRDDLSHWLAGEPIAARPPSIARRGLFLLRRHRAVAAALVVATVITASVFAWRIAALNRDRQIREVTASLEQRVRYIETLIDYDRRLSLHDTRGVRRRALAEIERLRSDPSRLPAPAYYAEGRALLAVGESRRARELLNRAWEGGLRNGAVAYHLGTALTAEYERQLAESDRIAQAALRSQREAELRRQYRTVVLPLLERARDYPEQPPKLIEAHIAHAEGHFESTLRSANVVLQRFPWNNDARLLEANAFIRRARAERQQGKFRDARASLGRAQAVLDGARSIAPSDLRVAEARCNAAVSLFTISYESGGDVERDFSLARSACEEALVADPERVPVLVALSSAWTKIAFQRGTHGGSVVEELKKPIELAERALRLAPNDPAALIQAGSAHYFSDLSSAPRVAALMRKAVQLSPGSLEAQHNLGRALLRLNDYARIRGEDSRPYFNEGIAVYRSVIATAPDFVPAYNNLALMLNHKADYTVDSGGDPEPVYLEILSLLEPLLAKHPEVATFRSTAAITYVNLAQTRWLKGADPSKELDRAGELYAEAVKRNENYWGDQFGIVQVNLVRASTTRDRAVRERALVRADADIKRLEARGIPAAREAWHLLKAEHASDRGSALHHLAEMNRLLDHFMITGAVGKGTIYMSRAHGEMVRCRFAPEVCDRAKIEEFARRAVEADRKMKLPVKRLMEEWQRGRSRHD